MQIQAALIFLYLCHIYLRFTIKIIITGHNSHLLRMFFQEIHRSSRPPRTNYNEADRAEKVFRKQTDQMVRQQIRGCALVCSRLDQDLHRQGLPTPGLHCHTSLSHHSQASGDVL